jgi:hypothetical protein
MFYNKNIIKIAALTILMISLGSCKKDFLNVVPKGVAIATKTSDYERLLNDPNLNALGLASQIVMSDELAGFMPLYSVGLGVASVSDQKAFEYQEDVYLASETSSELTQLERQLYSYNKVINEVMDSKEGNETQKKALLSEALAGRAWVHFMLINYYGKPYNAATATSDPGIPLVTIADVTQTTFTRASVQAAYDLIIADLNKAIPDLPVQIISRHRMSKSAAEAILGKVYVYMQQFDKALPLLTSSVSNLSNASISVGLYDFNGVFSTGGAFYPSSPITGPNRFNLATDKEVLYLKNFINLYSYIYSGFPVTTQTVELYSAADLRLNFFTASPFPPTGTVYPNKMMRCYGRYNNMGINIPDIYLLKAECESRLGDLNNAVAGLVAFRKTRMQKDVAAAADIPANIASDKVALTKYILEERIREFATSGERWWDMRRLSVDDTYKTTLGMVHHIYDAAGNIVKSYPLKSERLTFRFPQYIMTANPGLHQNP